MPAKGEYPGLQRKPPDANGFVAMYWAAPRRAVRAGYPSKTVRLHNFVYPSPQLAARCQQLWAEMETWLAEQCQPDTPIVFDGTIGGLIRLYQTVEDSTYHDLEDNTRKLYDGQLRQIGRVAGIVRLDQLHGIDFRRWYKRFKQPKHDGDREHVAGAHGLLAMVRILLKFGAELGLVEAKRLRDEIRARRLPEFSTALMPWPH